MASLAKEKNDLVEALIKLYELELPCYATCDCDKYIGCDEGTLCDSCKAMEIIYNALEAAGRLP